ncbi:MAG: 16S rRNA (adenine(1518)-N(6)/adenine(1519)-N(6))-dimethyltransferase RsmA [Coxiellaceae bacterium]|jgi:16S rRNA (adenine1518-N6/adenine1519-N6)-dimethyltransferase|nr:16S rRNA (adenine(1518)-N(6)/adenine(1519)-N(6))-dimethyltransferase RsmA [Coxiellaceae bacterium]
MIIPKKKSLGQHFLHDQNIIKKIIRVIFPKLSDNLIEIGPGEGALTTKLLPLVTSLNVIEIDKRITPILEKNCNFASNLHIYINDVLRFDFTQFKQQLRLIGNLPYNISTPLLFYLIKNISVIEDMHFMLQKEIAKRIIATPGSKVYGRLSVILQYYCNITLLFKIGNGAFSPPPKVDSVFVKFEPRKHHDKVVLDENKFSEIVRLAFNQRRKTIANNLKQHLTISQLEKIVIKPGLRPEQLSINDFITISNYLSQQ